MNLLLLETDELIEPDLAAVAASRYPARPGWWPPQPGRRLRVALRDGLLGQGVVEDVGGGRVRVRFSVDRPPPPPLPLTLVLALPRPKMLRRLLRTAAELGIKRIFLVNGARVEKSYWQSPLLSGDSLHAALRDGLEQACDSVMPRVFLRPRLRPFVEDELADAAGDSEKIVAHPAAEQRLPGPCAGDVTLAIGPEGGFSAFELQLFGSRGFLPRSLGARILRCETALPVFATAVFAGGAAAR